MADKPIIFSAAMVRALLSGQKSQTRRVLKPAPYECSGAWWITDRVSGDCLLDDWANDRIGLGPRYAPGDRLWVRETFFGGHPGCANIIYRADGESVIRWRSPIHMPRWASRLTLTVTDVRVQRLQEISEADAVAEGIERQEPTDADHEWALRYAEENGCSPDIGGVWIAPGTRKGWGLTQEERDQPQWGPTAAFAYRCVWNSLYGPEAWDANPWVAAITFTVHRCNIDRMGEDAAILARAMNAELPADQQAVMKLKGMM
ncbi:hypothetical protein [Neotabrizicola sp. VNH66]|uniref:hypothetical protein n=1 Tax=Neotabrizicola sp. VNH66 TaxID=3400918 RepID=UPI003BFC48E3